MNSHVDTSSGLFVCLLPISELEDDHEPVELHDAVMV